MLILVFVLVFLASLTSMLILEAYLLREHEQELCDAYRLGHDHMVDQLFENSDVVI